MAAERPRSFAGGQASPRARPPANNPSRSAAARTPPSSCSALTAPALRCPVSYGNTRHNPAHTPPETGPGRSLSIVSLLTVIYYATLFSLVGIFIDTTKIFYKILLSLLTLISILFLTFTIYSQFILTKHFSQACDERLEFIEVAVKNNSKGTLELKRIPPAGMLYWDELSEDSSYFTNKHLKDGLNLPFHVKLKSK